MTWVWNAVLCLIPLASLGYLSWLSPLLLMRRHRAPGPRRRLLASAVALGALVILTFVLLGVGAGGLGVVPVIVAAVGGEIITVVHLSGSGERALDDLPGVAEALRAQHLREEYRAKAVDDPHLCKRIAVGRPDLQRTFDDGGLVDLNNITAAGLLKRGYPDAEVDEILRVRGQLGGTLSSVDDLVVEGDLPLATIDRLRDEALFLPG